MNLSFSGRAVFEAVTYNDLQSERDPNYSISLGDQFNTELPLAGGKITKNTCIYWDRNGVSTTDKPTLTNLLQATKMPVILQSAHDITTPLDGAVSAANALDNRLGFITVEQESKHVLFPYHTEYVDAPIINYFLTGLVPPPTNTLTEQETDEYAASLLQRKVLHEQCFNQPLVLHSDNGAPIKSVTMKTKMEDLGITGSHSRPRVSNDNPFSESLFRTLKYSPTWPSKGFKSLAETRHWVQSFVDWYNEDHRHSRIGFVTPAQKHQGEDALLLAQRKVVYENAKSKDPARWSGETRKWEPVIEVTLNPEKPENTKLEVAA